MHLKDDCNFLHLFRLQRITKPTIVYASHKGAIWQNI